MRRGLRSGLLFLYLILLPVQFPESIHLPLEPADVVLLITVALYGQYILGNARWSWWHLALFSVFSLGFAVGSFQIGHISTYALLNKLIGLLDLFLTYAVFQVAVESFDDLSRFVRSYVFAVTIHCLVATLEFLASWTVSSDTIPWLNSQYRLQGLLTDPNAFGGLLVTALLLLAGTHSGVRHLVSPVSTYVSLVILSVGLILTFSRSAWLAMLSGMLVLGVRRPKFVATLLAVLGVAGFVLIGVLDERHRSIALSLVMRSKQIETRLDIARNAMNMFFESPLFGGGLGVYLQRYGYVVHNTALWFLAEFGLIGFIVFAVFVLRFVFITKDIIRRLRTIERGMAIGLLSAHFGMLGLSMGIEAFYQRQWWVLLGLLEGTRQVVVRKRGVTGTTCSVNRGTRLAQGLGGVYLRDNRRVWRSIKVHNPTGDDEMLLANLTAPVLRRWRVVVLITIVSVCLVLVRLLVVAPEYEAEARLIVLAPNQAVTDLQTLQLYRSLVPAYQEILSSRRVMDAVLRELGVGWSPDEYRSRVRIKANEESQTLDVVVRASSPIEAARIATDAAEVMTRVAADVMQEERLVLLDAAAPPEKPVSPRPTLEIALGALVGLMAGSGVAITLEALDRRIRDEAAVERRLGLPVLGVIPHIDL